MSDKQHKELLVTEQTIKNLAQGPFRGCGNMTINFEGEHNQWLVIVRIDTGVVTSQGSTLPDALGQLRANLYAHIATKAITDKLTLNKKGKTK